MRVYKFLTAHFGMKSLYERRLKISTINDLNDPFELTPFDLSERTLREAILDSRNEMVRRGRGLLCFSAMWNDPVIWAHYSDKHRGLCLGFDIADEVCRAITYVSEKLPFPNPPVLDTAFSLLFTKFSNWAYEQEIRVWAELKDQEDGLYYSEFGNALRLVEVIAGANCTVPCSAVTRALGSHAAGVRLTKSRGGL